MDLRDISNNLGISATAATHRDLWCYKVVLNGIMDYNVKLRGPGRTVEIDESKFGERKYHRGYKVKGQRVFGGIERETRRVVMIVPGVDRSRKTLLKIIKDGIEPGTTIISGCSKAYNVLNDEGYIHLTVNHELNMDPVSGAHTNSCRTCATRIFTKKTPYMLHILHTTCLKSRARQRKYASQWSFLSMPHISPKSRQYIMKTSTLTNTKTGTPISARDQDMKGRQQVMNTRMWNI